MRALVQRVLATLAIACAASFAPVAPAAASDHTCGTTGFKQVNFLVGNWIVSTPDGTVIGHDSFIHALGDCGFYEYWRDAAGNHRAFSILAYQPGANSWHLNWLDDSGMTANFDGSPTKLVPLALDGVDYMEDHQRMHHLTWTVLPNGSIEKIWKSSSDDGRHWAITFDGIYRRERI